MAGAICGAGCAIACDTPRSAKSRISAPRTELARLPSGPARQVGRCDRGRIRPRRNRRACAGDVQPPRGAVRRARKSVGLGHHDQVRPVLMGMRPVRQECIMHLSLVRYAPIFCRPYTRGADRQLRAECWRHPRPLATWICRDSGRLNSLDEGACRFHLWRQERRA